MTASMKMETERSHMTERILNLTLEIICLLTGERCAVVKMASMEGLLQGLYPPLSGELNPVAPPPSPDPERSIQQKILEVISQVFGLLTGETGSPGCDLTVAQETKDEDDGGALEAASSGEQMAVYLEPAPEEPSLHISPDACSQRTRPDSVSEDEGAWPQQQVQGEEPQVRGDQLTTAQVGVTIKEEAPSPETSADHGCTAIGPALSPPCKLEAEDLAGDDCDRRLPSPDGSPDPSGPEPPPPAGSGGGAQEGALFCFDCCQCFSTIDGYRQHQRHHSETPQHQCTKCGKAFKYKSSLVKHQRYHTGERPYPCPQCSKTFVDKSKLTAHLRLHMGLKQHTCPECGESFAYKSHLVVHQRFHTGEKTHSCPQCGNSYIFKSLLKKHLTTHTGDKPHVCPHCGKCFLWKSLLERHARKHWGEKTLTNPEGPEPSMERTNLS